MNCEHLLPRWSGLVIIAASGPSLTRQAAELTRGHRVVVVNDAYRLIPWAEVLYASDAQWWIAHQGCPNFEGEKWTTWNEGRSSIVRKTAEEYKLRVVYGKKGRTFSRDPAFIHHGMNSGFQAINAVSLWGGNPIVLIGFNFRLVNSQFHFFGKHPRPLSNGGNYPKWTEIMHEAAQSLPEGLKIINATPDSAIKCFPRLDLKEALNGTLTRHAS